MWEPPYRLGYSWHLGGGPDDATDVEIGFVSGEDDTTVVMIEHRGWERLGERADALKDRNQAGWKSLLPYLAEAALSASRLKTERGTPT